MKKIFLILCLPLLFSEVGFAQITMVLSRDTTICANQPVHLNAQVLNAPTTSVNYTISQISFQPDPFVGGTTFNLNDDDQTLPITMPFKFCFYGNTYSKFIISSNGWIGFSIGQSNSWYGAFLPNNSGNMPMNCIMAPFQDLNPHAGGTIGYAVYGNAPYRRLVVSYNNVPLYNNNVNSQYTCGVTFTGQIKLFETSNIIETHIANKPICTAWNSGTAIHALHDSIGNAAVIVSGRNYSSWSTTNEGMAFIPSGVSTEVINWYCNGNLIGNGNSILVSPSQTNTYTAIGYFGCGTTAQKTGNITVKVSNLRFDNPALTINPISCNGKNDGSIQANVMGGFGNISYLWNTNQTASKITNLSSGNYSVSIHDSLGCVINSNASLVNPQPLALLTKNVTFPSCNYSKDGMISVAGVGGTQPYQYDWSNGNLTNKNTQLSNGNYLVTISDAHQCIDTLSINIFTPSFSVNVGPDRTIGPNEYTPIRADVSCIGVYNYLWLPSYQLNSINNASVIANPHHTTNYKVVVTNQNNCIASDSVTIKVKFDDNLVLINAFSPNGDGVNDDFSFRKFADIFHLKELDIFNRWGEKVFASHDIEQGWDGSFKGKPQETGAYVYQALIVDYSGEEHLVKGNVNLIR